MKKLVLSVLLALLTVFFAFGTTDVLAGVKVDNGAPVYVAEDENNLLGKAADFGIFAHEVYLRGHAESNVACIDLYYQNLDPTYSGYFYAKNFFIGYDRAAISKGHNINQQTKYFGSSFSKIDVYIDNSFKIKLQENGTEYKLTRGEESITIDCSFNTEFHNESADTPFIDIDKELESLKSLGDELVKNPHGASYDFSDQNKKTIVCSEKKAVLNIEYEDFNKDYDKKINIKGIKDTDNFLIINIVNIPSDGQVYIDQIYFDDGDPETNYTCASRVLWNFASFDGTIYVNGLMGGTILAPAAFVSVDKNLVGSVIAAKVENGSEVHQIPCKIKKTEEPSQVTVRINSVDGTCCPSVDISGITAVLYRKNDNNNKYKKYGKDAVKTTVNAYAEWTVKDTGSYYIREESSAAGFAKTPIKCFFTVVEENGVLVIKPKEKTSEANGESTEFSYVNGNNSIASFKLRHYSDSLYLAAYKFGKNNQYKLVSNKYKFVVTNLDNNQTVNLEKANGLAEDYDMFEAHITEPGQYRVDMYKDNELVESKFVDAYLLPVGAYNFVENEFGQLADDFKKQLGTSYTLTKLKASAQKEMVKIANSDIDNFEMMTDGCIFFNTGSLDDAPLTLAEGEIF